MCSGVSCRLQRAAVLAVEADRGWRGPRPHYSRWTCSILASVADPLHFGVGPDPDLNPDPDAAKIKSQKEVTKQLESRFLLGDRRIRIRIRIHTSDKWIRIRIRNTDFSAGMRKAVIFFTCYLLLGALSPVLHVEGSRTRPGIIMVSRYLFFLSSFFSVVAFHLPIIFHICSIAFSRHCLVHRCSLFCSLSLAAILHWFSSLLFVTTFRHYFSR